MITRYAIVRNARDQQQLEAYLSANYKVNSTGEIVERVEEFGGRINDKLVFVIEGKDEAGWTLDGYVIPRLASGLIFAEEIDLSHPIMKEVL